MKKIFLTNYKKEIEIAGFIWHLDSPINESNIENQNLQIKGWISYIDNQDIELKIKSNNSIIALIFNEQRPDVAIKKSQPISSILGFNHSIQIDNDFDLEVFINKKNYHLCTINIKKILKVIEGNNGYLFLDNDTNKSVDQFTGKIILDNESINEWGEYFKCIEYLANKMKFQWIYLLAPSKEYVISNQYKFNEDNSTVKQLLLHFGSKIYWPKNELSENWNLAYSMLDTHWTYLGAYIIFEKILDYFNMKADQSFNFKIKKSYGDLGSKLDEKRKEWEFYLDSIDKYVIFDNQINNHGKVKIFRNNEVDNDNKLLILGDSYGTYLLDFFSIAFKELIYIHTASEIDQSIIENYNPTHIIFQNNSRFITKAPKFDLSLRSLIQRKISLLTLAEYKKILENISEKKYQSDHFFLDMLKKI